MPFEDRSLRNRLSENQVLHLHPDILEETVGEEGETIIYSGFFRNNADIDTPDGCIIRRTIVREIAGKKNMEIMYGKGETSVFSCIWNNRTITEYRFSRKI